MGKNMTHLEHLGLLNLLKRLAEGIVAVVGPHCEVVVHDFSDLEHSVVVVEGNVSGRKPGAPVPDIGFVPSELERDISDQLNYRIQLDSQELRSSTIWVRDDDGKPLGAVCININFSGLLQARSILDHYTQPARENSNLVVSDTLAKNLDELIEHTVSAFLHQNKIPSVEKMTQSDKQRCMEEIEKKGLFKLRGAAQRLADVLNVSRASIYNYRVRIRDGEPLTTSKSKNQKKGKS